jgi:hypothetical protein
MPVQHEQALLLSCARHFTCFISYEKKIYSFPTTTPPLSATTVNNTMSINNNIFNSALPLPMPQIGTTTTHCPVLVGLRTSGEDFLLQIHRRRGRSSSSGERSNKMKRKELEIVEASEKSVVSIRKVARAE